MSIREERHILEELTALRLKNDAFKAKRDRGERFSAAEQRDILEMSQRASELVIEARKHADSRDRSASQAPSSPAFSGGADSDTESRAFTSYLRSGAVDMEMRAAGEASSTAGGYLVPPGWWQRLQVAVKAYGGTANDFEQIESDSGQPMQWATTDPTSTVGTLIAENTQISDVDYTFGQGVLSAYMFTSGVQKVSFQLANDSAFDIDQFVQARVAESLGRSEAASAISGTGSAQPLGVITALAATSGMNSGGKYTLGTGKEVNVYGPGSGTSGIQQVTELTANALAPDTVNSLISSVDVAYRAQGAKFYFNDSTLAGMRNVVDGYGQPMYKGLQSSDISGLTLQGYGVTIDNNVPSLTASTASGVMFGHMASAMVLRRVKGAGILRLEERYADFLQLGFIGYERLDSRSNDLRAVSVAMGAAS